MVRLRIAWTDGITDGAMASRAVGTHSDHGVVAHQTMVVAKSAVAGRAIVGVRVCGTHFP